MEQVGLLSQCRDLSRGQGFIIKSFPRWISNTSGKPGCLTRDLMTALSTGRAEGMITMEQSLAELARSGRITRDTALAHGFRSEALSRYLEA